MPPRKTRPNDGVLQDGRPSWVQQSRHLTFASEVILRLKHDAPNMELILVAFEEEGWPERIDDPLPATNGINRKQHLRDTLRNLNRRTSRVRFHSDGTGQGIRWEAI